MMSFRMFFTLRLTLAKLFEEHVICRHGVPEELLSDRGTNFLSDLIKGVCEILGVKKISTSGYINILMVLWKSLTQS